MVEATARPSWMRWSRKAWRKPGPGRHRPLAGCRPRAAARPGQFIPDAHRGRRRRVSRKRADHARPARSHQALQRLHRPDPGALRSRHLRRGALRQRGRGRSRRAARFPAGLGAPRAGRQHRHRRHPLGRAGRKGRADGEAGRAVAPGRARRAAPLRAGFGLAEEALDADRDAANLEASLPGCTPNGSPPATRWPCCWAARPTRRRPTWPSAR